MLERHALQIVGSANSLMNELLRYTRTNFHSELSSYQVQDQIDRRCSAGACESISINRKDASADADFWKGLHERRAVFPVSAATIAVQQSGLCQDMGSGTNCAEVDVSITDAFQPAHNSLGCIVVDAPAATDNNDIQIGENVLVVNAAVHINRQAVAGYNAFARFTDCPPAIEFRAADSIRHAQGLYSR
jgi:hypothetical protein